MRALIVAAGEPPSKELLKARAAEADIIIAADGGADCLFDCGIKPNIVLGDFDSADAVKLERLKRQAGKVITLQREKDETDSCVAVDAAVKSGAKSAVMLGALGRRIDHTLANIMLLEYARKKGVELVIEDEYARVWLAEGETVIHGEKGQTVSLLPFGGRAVVSRSEGLYYPLCPLEMNTSDVVGVSNVLTCGAASINVSGKLIVVLIKKG